VNVIDVYFIDVTVPDDVIEALSKSLTAAELARANRYRFDGDRRRSIVARAATRRLLGRNLNADPRALVIVEEEHGKPALLNREIEFNASHSGDLVALAFAQGTPVGIDVERRRQLNDALALAERFFSAGELARVRAAEDAGDAFFTIWTAKESLVKATGKGIATGDLRAFTVPVRDREMRPVVQPRMRLVVDSWSVAALDPPLEGYYAAVAARAAEGSITSCTITPATLL
jgi:4'-phosphopantetheinyl transferase